MCCFHLSKFYFLSVTQLQVTNVKFSRPAFYPTISSPSFSFPTHSGTYNHVLCVGQCWKSPMNEGIPWTERKGHTVILEF